MPCPSKSKQDLRAQAALARSSRASSRNSKNPTWPSTPHLEIDISPATSVAPTPPMSPAPPELSANFSEEENDGFDEVLAPEEGDSPDGMVVPKKAQSACPNDDDGYGTWDDMSELEDEGLKDSLLRQKVVEDELNLEIGKGDRNAFHTLM